MQTNQARRGTPAPVVLHGTQAKRYDGSTNGALLPEQDVQSDLGRSRPTAPPVTDSREIVRSVLLLAGLCGVLAGCSWTGSGAGTGSAVSKEPLPRATRVRGVIVASGGPAPGSHPVSAALIRFVGSKQSAVVAAATDGRFTLLIAPGKYRVEVVGHGPVANGKFIRPIPDFVVIKRGGTLIRLAVSIK
jgi:hypothetical protein